jgi:hypothetical protein
MIGPKFAESGRLRVAVVCLTAWLIRAGAVEAAPPPPDAAAEATAMEKKMLDAINRGDKATSAALMSEDFVMLDYEGRKDKTETLRQLSSTPIEMAAKVHDMQAQVLSPDTMLVTYGLVNQESGGEENQSGVMWISSIWARRNGKWLNVFSQWSATATPPPAAPPADAPPTAAPKAK